jgi:hypothetical protein
MTANTVRPYQEMERSDRLTADEVAAGWRFCREYDDLLTNAVTWPHCRENNYMCGHCRPRGETDEQQRLPTP